MASEQEELKLVVTLDDQQASAKLANLKAQLDGMGSSGKGFDAMGKGAASAGKEVKGLEEILGRAVFKGTFLANMLTEVVKGLVDFGTELAKRYWDIDKASRAMVEFSTNAYRMGQSTAQFRENMSAFREIGVSAEKATQNLMGFNDSMADLATINGQLRGKLLSGGFLEIPKMLEVLESSDLAKTPQEQVKVWAEAAEEVRKFWTEAANPQMGAKMERQFLAAMGAPDINLLRRSMREVTAWQRELNERRDESAEKYLEHSSRASEALERTVTAAQSLTGMFSTWLSDKEFALLEKLLGWMDRLDARLFRVPGQARQVERELPQPEGWERFNPFSQRNIDREQRAIEMLRRQQEEWDKEDAEQAKKEAEEKAEQDKEEREEQKKFEEEHYGKKPEAAPMKFMGGSVQGGDWDSSGFTRSGGGTFWPNLKGRSDVDIEDRRGLEDNTDQTKALTEQMRQLNDNLTTPLPGHEGGLAAMGAALGGGGGGGRRGLATRLGMDQGDRAMPQGLRSPTGDVADVPPASRPAETSKETVTTAQTGAGEGGTKIYEGGTAKQKVAQTTANELRKQGFSENAIAGMLANVKEESAFNPETRHADQPKFGGEAHFAHGLFQEGGAEWNTWAADMKARGLDPNTAWKDPGEQARFVAGRLKGTIGDKMYAKLYQQMQAAKTPQEAAALFAKGYLRPKAEYLQSRLAGFEQRGVPGVEAYTGKPTGEVPPAASTGGGPAASVDGEARLKTAGNYKLGGDTRRQALLDAAQEASKNLPPGYRVEAFSGQREGAKQGPHRTSGAIDFRIIDPEGHELKNYQDPKNFAMYERFAQDTHAQLLKTNPALAAQHRFGGYFSGAIGPGGKYGAMDLMHQDLAGKAMAAGGWATGLSPEWARRWGVGEHSAGFAARQAEAAQAREKAADLDKAITRGAELDKEREMTVRGEGKLQVDVNGPPGTKVSGSGEGLLKDTSISRGVQMEPASSGSKQASPELFPG